MATTGGAETDAKAAAVTKRLSDGLAGIPNIQILAAGDAAAASEKADCIISGDLDREGQGWVARMRLSATVTGEVKWSGSVAVPDAGLDPALQVSRLTAGIGYPLR